MAPERKCLFRPPRWRLAPCYQGRWPTYKAAAERGWLRLRLVSPPRPEQPLERRRNGARRRRLHQLVLSPTQHGILIIGRANDLAMRWIFDPVVFLLLFKLYVTLARRMGYWKLFISQPA